jgi:glycerophosphoryl diester phosphodiesterase
MVKVIAHRGDSVHAPENTIMAFEKAIELGTDGIELDVHMCKDGYLVVHHDETVNTPDGKMLIRDMKLEELKQLDMGCGQKIPTLTEVFRLIGNMDFFINIEIKTGMITYDDIEHCLADEIRRFDMVERTLVSSFNHYSLRNLKCIEPAIAIGLLYQCGLVEPWWMALRLKARSLNPFYANITPSLVRNCQYYGIELYPWTVDNPIIMNDMINAKVTGIITNDPAKLLDILRSVQPL